MHAECCVCWLNNMPMEIIKKPEDPFVFFSQDNERGRAENLCFHFSYLLGPKEGYAQAPHGKALL